MKTFRLACIAVLLLAAWSASLRADPITQIVSFGDSLSDVGNTYAQYHYPPAPPYAQGRYSNGPIWLDRLASKLGLPAPVSSSYHGLNYAWGGAATDTPMFVPVAHYVPVGGFAPLISPTLQMIGSVPNVNTQISAYLFDHATTATTLYTLWAGANDFFDGQTNPLKLADNIAADVQNLISDGAKNLLVANLPSLGQTPLGRAEGPTAQAGLNTLTQYYNAELNADLNAIQAVNPEVQIHQLDVYGLFQSVEANPAAFGLEDVTDPAVLAPAGTDVSGFLFWDDVHPTEATGGVIADAAYRAVGAPEPSSVVLLLTGCAGLIGCGRLRLIRRLRAFTALSGLLSVCLIGASAPCRAQTPPPLSAADDPAEAADALAPAAGVLPAPAEPLFRHFKFDETWLAGENSHGLGIDDLETSATVALPPVGDLAPLLLTPGAAVHFWNAPRRGAFAVARPALPSDLYDASLEIGWQPKLAEWLYGDLAVTPGLYSDSSGVNSRSFQTRGRALTIVAFSPRCQVVCGAIYVNYNQTKLLPAGGLVWNPDDDTKLQLCFPQPKLARRLGGWYGAQWWGYVAGEFGGGRWSTERAADGASESIDYTDARALLGVEWLVPKGLSGRAEVGYVFDRRVTTTGGAPDYTPTPTVLARAGVRF